MAVRKKILRISNGNYFYIPKTLVFHILFQYNKFMLEICVTNHNEIYSRTEDANAVYFNSRR